MDSFRATGRPGLHRRRILLICGLGLLGLAFPVLAAAPAITASYRQAGGNTLVIDIRIGSPPPSSMIVVQQLPAGVGLTGATPPPSNINDSAAEAKWLLRDISQGILTITMTLDREVAAADVSAEVRYMAAGGGMRAVAVSKP